MSLHEGAASSRMDESDMAYAPFVATAPKARPSVHCANRYSDQPLSLRTRLCGMGGVGVVAALFAGGMMLSWQVYKAVKAPATLNVFNVAPPAAPPEPTREAPPGPEKIQKEMAKPDPLQTRIEPPKVEVPSANILPVVTAGPTPDPGPPVKETTAPESRPAPPAPQVSTGKPTWEGLVLGALNKVKRYPRDAHFARQQGVPYIRFVMNRAGKILSSRLERSSGYRSLDQEALSLPRRAQPLPKPPEDVKGDTIELVVPVEFFMR